MKKRFLLSLLLCLFITSEYSINAQNEAGSGVIIIYSNPKQINVSIPKLEIDQEKSNYDDLILTNIPEGDYLIKFSVYRYKIKEDFYVPNNDTLVIVVNFVDKFVQGEIVSDLRNSDEESEFKLFVLNELDKKNKPVYMEDDPVYMKDDAFYIVEEMPLFNGGDAAIEFRRFIAQNLRYPDHAAENKINGRVIVQFAIDSKGRLVDPVVVAGVDPSLDQEAIRVVSLSPPWTPGRQRGVAVKVLFSFPINFTL